MFFFFCYFSFLLSSLCHPLVAFPFSSPSSSSSSSSSSAAAAAAVVNGSAGISYTASLPGIQFPDHLDFNTVDISSADPPCDNLGSISSTTLTDLDKDHYDHRASLKLPLKHRSYSQQPENNSRKESVLESAHRDMSRIHTLHRRITERKNQNTLSRMSGRRKLQQQQEQPEEKENGMMATLASGVSQGSGEYFMDVYVGTPPRHFSLILDTGSDLNWIQCVPCHDCFQQHGPYYDPALSSSYRNISCKDHRCGLVSSPDPPLPCRSADQPCPYFYWYGDRSNTTGDLALEIFTVNITNSHHKQEDEKHRAVENVLFGCGHWNRGLFHGAAGLLGLGRGPLSFASQLRSLYGHVFSYCFVDRNSDGSVSSKLILGEDRALMSHPELNFTSFVAGKENPTDTFYYVGIKAILVGGELVPIPEETWELTTDAKENGGSGGTIIDSGTTLSYFAEPAYGMIRDAFVKKMEDKFKRVKGFPMLDPCYNVSTANNNNNSVTTVFEVPDFAILFKDGAVWNFPAENYFIRLEEEEVICLAILPTPRTSLSILGNYQQQNFHILYDTKRSRLGFAPTDCAHL